MDTSQPGILAAIPRLARHLTLDLRHGADPRPALQALAGRVDGESAVVGLGPSLLLALESPIEGLRSFPTHVARAVSVPATPAPLWLWLRGSDRGELLHHSRELIALLDEAFELRQAIDSFQYRDSRDLSGYEDGTENPEGDEAVAAAIVQGRGPGLDGSSFVAVQQWVHDLDYFQSLPQAEQDHIVGRRISDNEELEEAPASAHVKRTAQEDFEPAAFVVRRSMPWADEHRAGLVFLAFGHSLDAYEALLNRMTGVDDGIIDGLFRFTRPLTGSYYWCPPMKNDRLDLQAIGL
jgi:putative iron-dependent peroxidase